MPIYSHKCFSCSRKKDREELYEFYRPMSECSKLESCPKCGEPTSRVYSFNKPKEFQSYQDEKLGQITSASQERKMRKKFGLIDGRDTPAYQKFEQHRKEAKWRKKKGLV